MVLNFSAAMVSLYLLQSALLSAFGDDNSFRQTMEIILGAVAVIGTVIAVKFVYMIAAASVNIHIAKKNKQG